MRLTTRTNLAMRALMFCAVNADRVMRRQEVSDACAGSGNHLAQVIHQLGRKGYLRTIRGRAGGVQLARAPAEITVGQVFRDFEGSLPYTDCIGPSEGGTGERCPLIGHCRLTCTLAEALAAFYARLDRTTLADLVEGNRPLETILRAA